LETLVGKSQAPENPTALFFYEQSPKCLRKAVIEFESEADNFKPADCRANAERYSPKAFSAAFQLCIEESKEELFLER